MAALKLVQVPMQQTWSGSVGRDEYVYHSFEVTSQKAPMTIYVQPTSPGCDPDLVVSRKSDKPTRQTAEWWSKNEKGSASVTVPAAQFRPGSYHIGVLGYKSGDFILSCLTGEWVDGRPQTATGVWQCPDGHTFNGEWRDGAPLTGHGKFLSPRSGRLFDGEWTHGKGKGWITLAPEEESSGTSATNAPAGASAAALSAGGRAKGVRHKYEGEWSGENRHGNGRMLFTMAFTSTPRTERLRSTRSGFSCRWVYDVQQDGVITVEYASGDKYTGTSFLSVCPQLFPSTKATSIQAWWPRARAPTARAPWCSRTVTCTTVPGWGRSPKGAGSTSTQTETCSRVCYCCLPLTDVCPQLLFALNSPPSKLFAPQLNEDTIVHHHR
jgi:hypothetical protein